MITKGEKDQQPEKSALKWNLLLLAIIVVGADIRCSSVVDEDTADPTDIQEGAHVFILLWLGSDS